MANIRWHFKSGGILSDGYGHDLTFSKLVKFEDNAVRDIEGNTLPISVADADKLGGRDAVEFAGKDLLPATPNPICKVVSGSTALSNLVEENAYSQLQFIGQSNDIALPAIGDEKLPNTVFDTTDNVIIENDANISVADNVLRVNAETTDYPAGYMEFDLDTGKVYTIKLTLGGATPALDIIDPDGGVLLSKITDSGTVIRTIKPIKSGTHRFRMTMNSTEDDDTATFQDPSVKEIDLPNLKHGNYYTVGEADALETEIVTEIPSKDINYDPEHNYSNEPKNNLAFIGDDFKLLQYIGPTVGESGFVKDGNGAEVEYFIDNDGNYIGDFDVASDIDNYNIIGNTAKNHNSTNNTMELTRSGDGGNLEVYFDVDTDIGKKLLVSLDVSDVVSPWFIYLGNKKLPVMLLGDTATDNRTIRFRMDSTDTVSRFRLVCESNTADDKLVVTNITAKELDSSIWNDVTPIDNETSSPFYEWDNSEVEIVSDVSAVDVTLFFSTLLGSKKIMRNNESTAALAYRSSTLKQFTNRGFILGNYDASCNKKDINQLVRQNSFNRIRMHKDKYGVLSIVASDPVAGCSTGLCEGYSGVRHDIIHDLESVPYVVQPRQINSGDDSWYWGSFKELIENKNWCNWTVKVSDTNGAIVEGSGCGEIDSTRIEYYDNKNYPVYFKAEAPTKYRKGIIYNGNNSPLSFDLGFKLGELRVITSPGLDTTINKYVSLFTKARGFEYYQRISDPAGSPLTLDDGRISVAGNELKLNTFGANDMTNDNSGSLSVLLAIGVNVDGHTLKVPRVKPNTGLTGTSFKVITSDGMNENGYVNKLKTIDTSVIEAITKDNLK